ncbi:cell division protein FtsK [Candidatus Saccharibacteria bacterium]|nr:MAG: cell division protein FtsK [Candidatus Saccharibacteria bacterium]
MAKKKQTKRKKIKVTEPARPAAFWPYTLATVMMIVAVLMLLGAFGTGGSLPVNLYNIAYWLVGWVGLLVPIALIFFAIHKYSSEDNKVPRGKFFSMLGLVMASAGLMMTAFAEKTPSGQITGGHGGAAGNGVGTLMLAALDTVPASIVFILLVVVLACISFGIPLHSLLGIFSLFKRKKTDSATDLEELKGANKRSGFRLNEGVPVEHHQPEEREKPRAATLKNSAQKLSVNENHEALTLASDPNWRYPDVSLLNQEQDKADAGDVEGNARAIKDTFENFNIAVEMEGANIGPRVTQYTLRPPTGVKLTRITALENNLALDLAAHSIRMEAPIPGKRAVGIEVPNVRPATVRLSSIMQSRQWNSSKSALTFAIGKDISGSSVVADLAKMPHLLVAGQTGSGKSVMINDILTSLLYRNSPSDLKLILVDPKQVEMAPYSAIPHLLTPVINDPEKCISALKWAVAEMERRLRTMAEANKRNIAEYNNHKKEQGMPYIVIVIDELADLMMMAARDVEALIVRLAQKARAAGIHLVLATQRPSVDVITGLIKANIPARIAFTVASQVDSRTIIDQAGAEKLLGRGDMLLLTADMPKPVRVQAAFIEDGETEKVTEFLNAQSKPNFDDEVVAQPVQLNGRGGVVTGAGPMDDADEPVYREAVRVVVDAHKASTSLLQRRLRIGYGKAARLMETMEEQGVIGPADGSRPRDVLVSSMEDVFGGPASGVQPGDSDDDGDDEEPPAPQTPRERFLVQ